MIESIYYGIKIMKFKVKMQGFESTWVKSFYEGGRLDLAIKIQLKALSYEQSY